ncbi:MAG: ribonuclease HI family protein [Candidatus Omnitrophica bacterium]|nr:ribonuclease HI family protein [Candidatus Omnitrophota bacterium]
MRRLELFIDGASKGNPGPSGIGVIICQQGRVVKNIARYIGTATNNVAEYTALVHGLQESMALGAEAITVNTDSELLSRQVNGLYKIKNAGIKVLYEQVLRLKSGFKEVMVRHIPREENCGADKLATQAVKEALEKAL